MAYFSFVTSNFYLLVNQEMKEYMGLLILVRVGDYRHKVQIALVSMASANSSASASDNHKKALEFYSVAEKLYKERKYKEVRNIRRNIMEQAERMYSKCIFADNTIEACYNSRYLTRISLQQLDGALSDLKVVVERSPSSRVHACQFLHLQGYMQVGKLEMKLGKCKDATKSFQASLTKYPTTNTDKFKELIKESTMCASTIAEAEKKIVRKSYSDAITLLEKALETCTSADNLRINLSRLLLETSQWERLIQTCSTILRSRPDDCEVLYMRGWGFLMSGDKDTASTHFKKVSFVDMGNDNSITILL